MRCPRCKYIQEKADYCTHCGRDMRKTILICPDCGKKNNSSSNKCKCGKTLQDFPICSSCGAVADRMDSRFCAKCGKSLIVS